MGNLVVNETEESILPLIEKATIILEPSIKFESFEHSLKPKQVNQTHQLDSKYRSGSADTDFREMTF